MSKYKTKPVIIEAELYKEDMEDGYACYELFGEFIGFFKKNGPLPRTKRIPAIRTNDGWCEVHKGDYIITTDDGERYPCKPEVFEISYEKIEGDI